MCILCRLFSECICSTVNKTRAGSEGLSVFETVYLLFDSKLVNCVMVNERWMNSYWSMKYLMDG